MSVVSHRHTHTAVALPVQEKSGEEKPKPRLPLLNIKVPSFAIVTYGLPCRFQAKIGEGKEAVSSLNLSMFKSEEVSTSKEEQRFQKSLKRHLEAWFSKTPAPKPIAKGSMGSIYTCSFEGKRYALKIVDVMSDSPESLLREFRFTDKLNYFQQY